MSVVQWLQRAGEFQLAEQLGFNGVVATYKGFQPDTKMFVCVVALDKAETGDTPAFARFVNEFAALQNAPASRLVRGVAYGEESRFYWAAYEWMMRGRHLGHIVQDSGLPSPGQAFDLMSQVVEGLMTIQNFGFPHRIITPATIFINDIQQVKILYSGWASLILGVKGGAAHPNFMSNLPFLAPEIAAGHEGDYASDIYSVGANLYFLLTGQPTHWTDDPRQLARLISTTAVNLKPLRQVVSGAAAEVVEEMLELDPQNRPVNFEALRDRLQSIANQMTESEPLQEQEQVLDITDPVYEEPPQQAAEPMELDELGSIETIRTPILHMYQEQHEPEPLPQHQPVPEAPIQEQQRAILAAPNVPPPAATAPPPPAQAQPKPYRPPRKTRVSPLVVIWLLAGVFILVGGLGWVSWRFFLGPGRSGDTAAATPTPAPKAADPKSKELEGTKERLRALADYNAKYRVKYGTWATAVAQFEEFEAPAEIYKDLWGITIDVREEFIVSAGPDKKWETADDLWIDTASKEFGGKI